MDRVEICLLKKHVSLDICVYYGLFSVIRLLLGGYGLKWAWEGGADIEDKQLMGDGRGPWSLRTPFGSAVNPLLD